MPTSKILNIFLYNTVNIDSDIFVTVFVNETELVFLACLQRALLYSGVNQLANGRHSGEDKHRNALRTMQRAVLLCPGINILYILYGIPL